MAENEATYLDAAGGLDEYMAEQQAKAQRGRASRAQGKQENVAFSVTLPKEDVLFVHRSYESNGKNVEFDAVVVPLLLTTVNPENEDQKSTKVQWVECRTSPRRTAFVDENKEDGTIKVTAKSYPNIIHNVYADRESALSGERYLFRKSHGELVESHNEAVEATKVKLRVKENQVNKNYADGFVEVRLPAGIIPDSPHNEVSIFVKKNSVAKQQMPNGRPYYEVTLAPSEDPNRDVNCFLNEDPKVPESMGADTDTPVKLPASEIRDRYHDIRHKAKEAMQQKKQEEIGFSSAVRPTATVASTASAGYENESPTVKTAKTVPSNMAAIAAAADDVDYGTAPEIGPS